MGYVCVCLCTLYRIVASLILRKIDSNCFLLAVVLPCHTNKIQQISNGYFYKYLNKHCNNCTLLDFLPSFPSNQLWKTYCTSVWLKLWIGMCNIWRMLIEIIWELRLENPHADYNRKGSYWRTPCHRLQLLMNPGKYLVSVSPRSSNLFLSSPNSFSVVLWTDNSSHGKKEEKWMREEQEKGKCDVYQNKHGCRVCVHL